MKKTLTTLVLAIAAIFATNISAQNATQLIEKYKTMPKAELHKISGKKLQKQLKKEYSAEDYELLKGLTDVELLAVEPTSKQREDILADLNSLDDYTLIREDSAKIIPESDKPKSTFLVTLEQALVTSQINGRIYARGDEDSLSDIVIHFNFLNKAIIAHLSGKIPTSEAGYIVDKVVSVE